MDNKIARNNLRALRDRSRLSLNEVSVLTGYDVSTISKHEGHTRGLTPEAIMLYAKLYKVNTHELFDLAEYEEEE